MIDPHSIPGLLPGEVRIRVKVEHVLTRHLRKHQYRAYDGLAPPFVQVHLVRPLATTLTAELSAI